MAGKNNKKILVTGGGGYLGSVLVPKLLEKGYAVVVLDRFFFGREPLAAVAAHPKLTLVTGDTRSCPKEIFNGVYGVIDLAALANDPLSELDPETTLDINFRGRVRVATLAKEMMVKRYVLASSCSVYGFQEELLDESSMPMPLSTYAKACLLAEEGVLPLKDKNFTVTVLRQGTLYGLSPRMRFDLIINTITLAFFKKEAVFMKGGKQWRPLLHVADSAEAFLKVLEADPRKVNGEVFNVGSTENNYRVEKIVSLIAGALLNVNPLVTKTSGENERSYRVNCDKIAKLLNFVPQHKPENEAKEIYRALSRGLTTDSVKTRTLDWYKKLLAADPEILRRKI